MLEILSYLELERTPETVAVSAAYRLGPGSAYVVDLGLCHALETRRALPQQILGLGEAQFSGCNYG